MTRVSLLVVSLVAFIASLMLPAAPAGAQGPGSHGIIAGPQSVKAAIAVRVLNESGKPVRFAVVAVFNADGKKVAMRYTDILGRAFFGRVPPGDYTVRAGKVGQGKGQEGITVEEGKLTKVAITLKKQ